MYDKNRRFDTAALPEDETERQYYFIEAVKEKIAELSRKKGRALTYHVTTFGCQMNSRDSEKLAGILESVGYVEVEDPTMISEATQDKVIGGYYINALAESMYVSGELASFDGLVLEALEYLSKDEDGFFLMAEGARIDKGGHNNNFQQMLDELLAFDAAVEVVVNWAMQRDDTIVIVTADHETGGLYLDEKVNKKNLMIEGEGYLWETSGHTGVDVDCFIAGKNIDFTQYSFESADRIQNRDIFQIMKSFIAG